MATVDQMDSGEVWVPPGAWRPRIGERVRINISPECFCYERGCRSMLGGLYGRIRTIERLDEIDPRSDPRFRSHYYEVCFDQPFTYGDNCCLGLFLSLWEMEPAEAQGGR